MNPVNQTVDMHILYVYIMYNIRDDGCVKIEEAIFSLIVFVWGLVDIAW